MVETLTARLDDQLQRAVSELAAGGLPLSPGLLERLEGLLGAELILLPPHVVEQTASAALISAVVTAMERQPPGHWISARVDDTSYHIVVKPLLGHPDQRLDAIAAAAPLTDAEQAARQVAQRLGLLALVAVAILGGIAHAIGRAITRPIQGLVDLTQRLATGDLQARAPLGGPLEFRKLTTAVNEMAHRIAAFQQQLVEHNRLLALGEMAARIAHEIRNPLTAIKLHVQLLLESVGTGEDARALRQVLAEIERLELVVAATLRLGRSEPDQLYPASLNGLIEEVTALLRPQLAHRRIGLELGLGAIPLCALERNAIKQLLFNLLANAVDAAGNGGRIRLITKVSQDGSAAVLAVEDTGPGIPYEQRLQIFEQGVSTKPHGLGLGLLVAREIAQRHRGTLEIEDGATLGGARFVLTLPAIDSGEGEQGCTNG